MNTERDLNRRLLQLYPMKAIKEHFDMTGHLVDIIEDVIQNRNQVAIKEFSYLHHSSTKQNIYLFRLNSGFVRGSIGEDFPFIIEKEVLHDGEYTFFCLPKAIFSVYLSDPNELQDICFYQPVMIRVIGNSFIITYTKFERNLSAQFDESREAKKRSESGTESESLILILNYLRRTYDVEPNDLNRGIKFLWDQDILDCHKIGWTKSDSNVVETMHGTLTFKQRYPEEYPIIFQTPLGSALWKYMTDDDELFELFLCDVSGGTISITRFPKHSNQAKNVITKILANN